MGPSNNSEILNHRSSSNDCCCGHRCKTNFDIGRGNNFFSMWEDVDRLNTHIWNEFPRGFDPTGLTEKITDVYPPRYMRNSDLVSCRFLNAHEANQVKISNEETHIQMTIDTHGFDKEELTLSRQGDTITIEGRHKEKSSDGSSFVSKQFSRSYTLPLFCEMENMKSSLSDSKTLTITIPKKNVCDDKLTVRQIPIEMKNTTNSEKIKQDYYSNEQKKNRASQNICIDPPTQTGIGPTTATVSKFDGVTLDNSEGKFYLQNYNNHDSYFPIKMNRNLLQNN